MSESRRQRRARVLAIVSDMVSDLLYYDRKEDEELGVGDIEEAIRAGEVTIDEIVGSIRTYLERAVAK